MSTFTAGQSNVHEEQKVKLSACSEHIGRRARYFVGLVPEELLSRGIVYE